MPDFLDGLDDVIRHLIRLLYVRLDGLQGLLNLAGSLEAPTSTVSSSSLVTFLLNVDFASAWLALFPYR
jgi:hypothetical protein